MRPNSKLASDENIAHVWIDPTSDSSAIYYSSGILVLEKPSQTGESPEDRLAQYQAVVAEQDGASDLETINGVTALVTGQNFKGNGLCGTPGEDCIPPQNNPSDISMVLNSYFVEYDAPLPLSDLIDTAGTMS